MKHQIRAALLGAVAAGVLLTGCGGSDPVSSAPAPTSPATIAPPSAPEQRTAPARVGAPTLLDIPALAVRERLHPVGLKSDGAMQTPDFGDVGWYEPGPRPGAAGPSVIVAHVHGPQGDDVFADLDQLRPGDRVQVRRTDGVTTFVVDSVESNAKEALPHSRIWRDSEYALLRLITCGGEPDPVTRMYPDNTVVYAHAIA